MLVTMKMTVFRRVTLRKPLCALCYYTIIVSVDIAAMVGLLVFMFIFNYALQPFKAYCAIWVRRSNFRQRASPRVSPCKSTQRWKVELWARNVR